MKLSILIDICVNQFFYKAIYDVNASAYNQAAKYIPYAGGMYFAILTSLLCPVGAKCFFLVGTEVPEVPKVRIYSIRY